MKDLEEAQKAVEEGNALEPVLRQKIEELEDAKKDLMVYYAYCLLLYMVAYFICPLPLLHNL